MIFREGGFGWDGEDGSWGKNESGGWVLLGLERRRVWLLFRSDLILKNRVKEWFYILLKW